MFRNATSALVPVCPARDRLEKDTESVKTGTRNRVYRWVSERLKSACSAKRGAGFFVLCGFSGGGAYQI